MQTIGNVAVSKYINEQLVKTCLPHRTEPQITRDTGEWRVGQCNAKTTLLPAIVVVCAVACLVFCGHIIVLVRWHHHFYKETLFFLSARQQYNNAKTVISDVSIWDPIPKNTFWGPKSLLSCVKTSIASKILVVWKKPLSVSELPTDFLPTIFPTCLQKVCKKKNTWVLQTLNCISFSQVCCEYGGRRRGWRLSKSSVA